MLKIHGKPVTLAEQQTLIGMVLIEMLIFLFLDLIMELFLDTNIQ